VKKLFLLAARLYPAAWRDRYGVEFQALLDEITPGWLDIVDVINGGLQMHLRRLHPAVLAVAFGLAAAFVAGAVAVNTADRFVSTGTMSVKPWMPEDAMPTLARDAFSTSRLTGIIKEYDLYRSERASSPVENVVERMRDDINVQLVSRSVFKVSFASSDVRKAQPVANELMGQLVRSNLEVSRSTVQVIDPPDEPQRFINRRRVTLAGLGGFGGGALIGTLIGLFLSATKTQTA